MSRQEIKKEIERLERIIFTNWLEIGVMYTDYCIECDEKGIEPLNRKDWYEKIYKNWE